jgi:hypothetical protein
MPATAATQQAYAAVAMRGVETADFSMFISFRRSWLVYLAFPAW